MLKTSSISTGSGVACASGIVAPASKPALLIPGVSSMYFSPSAERGRTMNVESIGKRLEVLVELGVDDRVHLIAALDRVDLSITPTRAPPIRTSLPRTRLAALGSWIRTS